MIWLDLERYLISSHWPIFKKQSTLILLIELTTKSTSTKSTSSTQPPLVPSRKCALLDFNYANPEILPIWLLPSKILTTMWPNFTWPTLLMVEITTAIKIVRNSPSITAAITAIQWLSTIWRPKVCGYTLQTTKELQNSVQHSFTTDKILSYFHN